MERLFGDEEPRGARAPLAARMRPQSLEEVVGQDALLAEGAPLRRALDAGRLHSMILHGPPGSGKTTLARIIASGSGAALEEHSAVEAGRAEVRAVIERARHRGGPTVFFLDEIHRFNKVQQDALLPAVEDGTLTLIGATTENPRFEVISALLSRVRVYELAALAEGDVLTLLHRALQRGELGDAEVDEEALSLLALRSGGDARIALGALERAAAAGGAVDLAAAGAALASGLVRYDRAGDQHYDTISAWIKATRGSDVDASLYYLATMLEGGEDPRFIVRRMVILASEDVGNADPQALGVAVAAAAAVEHVGLPECSYALAQAAIYLSLAPKSDAAGRALGAARSLIASEGARRASPALRGAADYDNPHAHPGHLGGSKTMPEGLEDVRFYAPDDAEAAFAAALERVRAARERAS
ncbi:MAG TPA: replication-associated recombination protein A [Solirubrobacteraceae bacterium]|jgi:putative ATPase|nr:replication-associated recombination protein A [Solirubrobacteraceae bacterium]